MGANKIITADEIDEFNSLIPHFTSNETNEIKLYFETSKKFQKDLEENFLVKLKDHPIWGELLKSIPEDIRKANSKISEDLQYDAIYNENWLPYIKYQINQGITYAKMGYEFRSWYELVNLIRDMIIPYLTKEFEHDAVKMTRCLNGMNRFFDFAMSILGEAYIHEKRKVIEQQMRMQMKLNKELESFAFIISHDLKTPLRGISSLSSWIIDDYHDKLDETGKEYLLLLKSRVKRMEDLIDGVLRYSRVGRIDVERSEFDLDELVRELVEVTSESKEVELKIPVKLPVIIASKTILTQLFSNLVSNAEKYSDKEKVQIEIGYELQQGVPSFYVKDDGPGIPEEYHGKVFEIFQTLETKDDVESTGIGLTIVKKIVDSYGGEITIENPKEGGALFRFNLPDLKIV